MHFPWCICRECLTPHDPKTHLDGCLCTLCVNAKDLPSPSVTSGSVKGVSSTRSESDGFDSRGSSGGDGKVSEQRIVSQWFRSHSLGYVRSTPETYRELLSLVRYVRHVDGNK